jgi:flagellar protein FliS
MESNDIEGRTQHLNHVLSIVAHLQGTLDLENGGEVARTLKQFYSYARASILEVSLTNSKDKLADLASHFSSLLKAWQAVEMQTSGGLPPTNDPA